MDDLFTFLSKMENIELITPLMGFGIGLALSVVVVIAISIWFFFISRGPIEQLPLSYYNRHRTNVRQLRKDIKSRNKRAS